ncbi:MAG: type II toxin-antitoxin system HicB family antitoxin [Telluria sp.]
MTLTMECAQESDGRWLADVPELPGVMAYGASANDATAKAQVLALRVIGERVEHGESLPLSFSISLPSAV